jgi:hypothetical protein
VPNSSGGSDEGREQGSYGFVYRAGCQGVGEPERDDRGAGGVVGNVDDCEVMWRSDSRSSKPKERCRSDLWSSGPDDRSVLAEIKASGRRVSETATSSLNVEVFSSVALSAVELSEVYGLLKSARRVRRFSLNRNNTSTSK